MLKKEKSCGCIIINNDNKVLLVYEKNSHFWGFPKGHVEGNETEIETAVRECKEEVGLDVIIDVNKRYPTKYIIDNKVKKTVIFYLAVAKKKRIVLQEEEIEKYKWCDFDEALEMLNYNNLKKVLKKALKEGGFCEN